MKQNKIRNRKNRIRLQKHVQKFKKSQKRIESGRNNNANSHTTSI